MPILTDIALLLVGVIVGTINAVAGGGMLIGFPVLLAAGVPPIVANASGKLVATPALIAASFGYRRFFQKVPKHYFWLIIPAVLGAAAGAYWLRDTSSDQFEQIVPWLLIAAVLVFASKPLLQKKIARSKRQKAALPFTALALLFFGLSVYSGYFGVGVGFMFLAILSFSSMSNIHHINTIKAATGAASTIVAFIVLAPAGLFDWQAGISMGIGSALGGYYTARHAHNVPEWLLRSFIIIFGLGAALYLLAAS
jgi:uncharacterized membrane protein YfcA